jgi:hypothetical protein
VQLQSLETELADNVVAVEGLAGIVEDPQGVLARAAQEEVERFEPTPGEVLAIPGRGSQVSARLIWSGQVD